MTVDVLALQSAVTRIMRALKIAEKHVQVAHRDLNFATPDIQTLRFVAEHPGCKLSDLAEHLGAAPTTASSIVDRLVERGIVLRERPETNRRTIALSLTPAGKDAFALIDAEEKQTMRMMLDALPEESRDEFIRSMTRIADKVSDA